jgi:3-hydroxyacyl-[acyl-carrier-protein] dehydratase
MTDYRYPLELDRAAIADLLPHRGDIFVCERLTISGPHNFSGVARWPRDNNVIRGHFPGMPIVPGVLLIEALAQLAGAGLLAGDPYVATLPAASLGVLAAVRNCWFKRPVAADSEVGFAIQCRQLAPLLVQVTGVVSAEGAEVAKLELSLAYVPREQVLGALVAVPA